MKALRDQWSRRVRVPVALAALGIPSAAALAGPVFFLPNGLGGYNAYELETGAVDLPTAFTTAAGRTFPGAESVGANAGVTGHVTTIRSAAHNGVLNNLRGINFGGNSAWLGLTDDPTLVAGASEAGNTAGNPLPNPGQEPVAGQRGFGYKWQSGEAFTYQNWNGGEPNNSGTGENGVELTGGATWNDNGPPAQPALTRQYVVEYNLNLAQKPGFQAGAPAGGERDVRRHRRPQRRDAEQRQGASDGAPRGGRDARFGVVRDGQFQGPRGTRRRGQVR